MRKALPSLGCRLRASPCGRPFPCSFLPLCLIHCTPVGSRLPPGFKTLTSVTMYGEALPCPRTVGQPVCVLPDRRMQFAPLSLPLLLAPPCGRPSWVHLAEPGCTWRLQKPTERAWARLALSTKRRNPGWRNIFLCGSVVLATGEPLVLFVFLTFRSLATSPRFTADPPGPIGRHASGYPD